MVIETIASWLGALKLPGKVVFGLFLFCLLLLLLDYAGIALLGAIHELAWLMTFIGLLLFGCLSLAFAGGEGYDAWKRGRAEKKVRARQQQRRDEEEAARAKFKELVLKRLDYLSPGEHRILADCLRANQQSFGGHLNDADVTSLKGAHLVNAPSGIGSFLQQYPHYIVDFVWEALLARRDAFLAKDDENQRREDQERRERERRR